MSKRLLIFMACVMASVACTASVDDVALDDDVRDSPATTQVADTDADTDGDDASIEDQPADDDGQGDDASTEDQPAGDEAEARADADAPGDAAAGFSVLAALAQIPDSATAEARSGLQVSVGDLDAAADQARIRRPVDSADVDDLVEFFGPLTGFSPDGRPMRVFVPLPLRLRDRGISQVDEFIDELGFSPGDVTSFVSLDTPAEFVVLAGVTATEGLPEVAPGVSTVGAGEDLQTSLDSTTAARPLGRPLRLSQQGGDLALSLSTPAVVDWNAGSGPTLADNATLGALATRLDEEEVVSAFLITREASYRAIGLGWRADDRGPRGVIVLSYDSEAAATEAFDVVAASFEAESYFTGAPISDLVVVEQIEVRGAEIVTTVEFANDRSPQIILDLLVRGDGPFAGS